MIITAWNNGQYHSSGAGYGFRVSKDDWEKYFANEQKSLTIILPSGTHVSLKNPPADSACREFRHKEIGEWLIEQSGSPPIQGESPWEHRNPPKYKMTPPENGQCIVS